MSTTVVVPHMKDYEKELDALRYDKQTLDKVKNQKITTSSFERLENVPFRRFDNINPKIRPFPLLETQGNCFYHDFEDGLGKVYSYFWKNNPNFGIVSFWFQFDDDSKIEIDKGSTVSSYCKLFAKNGKIEIKNSNLVNVEIWATDQVKIEKCSKFKSVFIFGAATLKELVIDVDVKKEKQRFYTKKCEIEKCVINGNNLFYQDMYYQNLLKMKQCTIDGQNEFIGNLDITQSKIEGKTKIAGKVVMKESIIEDNAYIDAGYEGTITIEKSNIADSSTVINSPTILESQIIGSALVSDFSKIKNSIIEDDTVITDKSSVTNSFMKGFSQSTMDSIIENSVFSGHASISGTCLAQNTSVSDYGIISGDGTAKIGGSVSGTGRVFNGVTCPHSVGGGDRHFNAKTCV